MSAFAGHGRAMQVDDDAFNADGGGGDNKALYMRPKNNDKEQNNRHNDDTCNYSGAGGGSDADEVDDDPHARQLYKFFVNVYGCVFTMLDLLRLHRRDTE
jgi:hypothetical protein